MNRLVDRTGFRACWYASYVQDPQLEEDRKVMGASSAEEILPEMVRRKERSRWRSLVQMLPSSRPSRLILLGWVQRLRLRLSVSDLHRPAAHASKTTSRRSRGLTLSASGVGSASSSSEGSKTYTASSMHSHTSLRKTGNWSRVAALQSLQQARFRDLIHQSPVRRAGVR